MSYRLLITYITTLCPNSLTFTIHHICGSPDSWSPVWARGIKQLTLLTVTIMRFKQVHVVSAYEI